MEQTARSRILVAAALLQLSQGLQLEAVSASRQVFPRHEAGRRDVMRLILGGSVGISTNANALVPGGEFCICRPDGQCFGQNCGGLKPVENTMAQSFADAKSSYSSELRDVASALKRRRDVADDSDRVSVSSSTSSASSSSSADSSSTAP